MSATNILGWSFESLPSPVLLSELNRGQHARFQESDAPHVLSLLAGIGEDDELEAEEPTSSPIGARPRGT